MAVDMAAIGRALWRAKIWVIPLAGLIAAGSFVGLSAITPRYKAEAKILIEPRSLASSVGLRDVEPDRILTDQEGVASQVQLITSRNLARRVVEATQLGDLPEFQKQPGLLQRLLPFMPRGRVLSPQEQTLELFAERLTVFPIERTRVITVEFVSTNPDVAARVGNAVVTAYLAGQAEAKVNSSTEAVNWLDREIGDLRGRVAEAEAKVEAFRTKNNLFSIGRDGSLVEQQMSGLNQQLSTARNDRTALEARTGQLRRLIDSGGTLDASGDAQNSTVLQRLRERETTLRGRMAELSITLLPGHPQIKAIQVQLADLSQQKTAEGRRILAALETDLRAADQKITEMEASLSASKAVAARANESDIELRALERDAKAQRDLLETFLARSREALSRKTEGAQPPDARAISEASPPSLPYFPKVLPMTMLITAASLIVLLGFIILRELLSGRALRPIGASSSPVQMRHVDSRPVPDTSALISAVPVAPAAAAPSAVAQAELGPHPLPTVADIVARLRTAGGAATLSVVGTDDALARRLSLSLARQSLAVGRVCCIELSRIEPELLQGAGFSELVAGEASFVEIIHRDPGSRAHVVPFGALAVDDAALGTSRTAIVLDALAASYDVLIISMGGWRDDAPNWLSRLAAVDHILVAVADEAQTEVCEAIMVRLAELGHAHSERVAMSDIEIGRVAA